MVEWFCASGKHPAQAMVKAENITRIGKGV